MATITLSAQSAETLRLPGLEQTVEIIVDTWGIPHIYAQTENDLFFAQGWNVARDRLFQLEVWRRQATGTVAEWLGPSAIERDHGTRLFRFRGDMEREMAYYHPRGGQIIRSFVRGINAYIDWVKDNPTAMPPEFAALDLEPGYWTPEVVISRHQGLLGNIEEELNYGRQVARLGADRLAELSWFHPNEPDLRLDPKIDTAALREDILRLYHAFRQSLDARNMALSGDLDSRGGDADGSNNWVVNGERTASGYPMLANDPHRTVAVPSLRYMAHLAAPGWNVIGGGEPSIPGISIGHNEYGAWGLTVFDTDAEDLYVYEINPQNRNEYRYQGQWAPMQVLTDTIRVRGQAPVVVELKYTRHGPVVFEDTARHLAYTVRCGWLEIGGAPYLASLRMDQARTWEEFRDACRYSHIPGENMVWADRAGNIGWQAVGIAPVRPNWSGLVPVPGDGSYEWAGYLPIQARPHVYNPESGIIVTANENVTPRDYAFPDALSYEWAEPYRGHRVREVLSSGRRLTLMDMMQLQTDYHSLPARQLVPLLEELTAADARTEEARRRLLDWDFVMDKTSIPATVYLAWENQLRRRLLGLLDLPANSQDIYLPLKRVIDWLTVPDGRFGRDPLRGRDAFLLTALDAAVAEATQRLGRDMNRWQYGQATNKHVRLDHAFSAVFPAELQRKVNLPPLPRAGYGYTPGATGNGLRQTHGATFRVIFDLADWDLGLGTSAPGQSGHPDDPHYRDLYEMWANDRYFPLFYSRGKVESVREQSFLLTPEAGTGAGTGEKR